MIFDGLFWAMGWMQLIGAVIVALVIAALIKYVFLRYVDALRLQLEPDPPNFGHIKLFPL